MTDAKKPSIKEKLFLIFTLQTSFLIDIFLSTKVSPTTHNVWKSQKKSHSIMRAKRAKLTFSSKNINFDKFLKTWSLRSNSYTRQVTFNKTTKIKWDILDDFHTLCDYEKFGLTDFLVVVSIWRLVFSVDFGTAITLRYRVKAVLVVCHSSEMIFVY